MQDIEHIVIDFSEDQNDLKDLKRISSKSDIISGEESERSKEGDSEKINIKPSLDHIIEQSNPI